MDKIIENLVPLFLEWQQIVIDNIDNSYFLATLTFFVGILTSSYLAKAVASGLRGQLIKEKEALQLAENKHAKLVEVQLHDAEQMADLQQTNKQIEIELQNAEAKVSDSHNKQQQLSANLKTKQTEFEGLNLALKEKDQLLEDLQKMVDKQKKQLSTTVVDKLKLNEMERNMQQIDQQASHVKQQIKQLEEELKDKNQLIEGLDHSDEAAKINMDKIATLESQISQLKKDSVNNGEKEGQGSTTDYAIELENTVKQHDQQLIEFNKKLQLLITSTIPDAVNSDLISSNKEDEGFVSKVLSLFASIDKATTGEANLDDVQTSSIINEDIWQQHHDIIEKLTHQLIAEENGQEAQLANEKNYSLASNNSTAEMVEKVSQQNVDLNTEKVENLDFFQEKLKGIYNKIIS